MNKMNILSVDGVDYEIADKESRDGIGDISALETTATTLVGAVNEIKNLLDSMTSAEDLEV